MRLTFLKSFMLIGAVWSFIFINAYGMQQWSEQAITVKMDAMIVEYEASIKQFLGSDCCVCSDQCMSLINEQSEKKIQAFKRIIADAFELGFKQNALRNSEDVLLVRFADRIRAKKYELSETYKQELLNKQERVKKILHKSGNNWPDIK